MITVKLTRDELKQVQFAIMKNQERLQGIVDSLGKGDYVQKMYRAELKKYNLLEAKFRINIYA